MTIFFFRLKVTPTSEIALKEVVARDAPQAVQTLATWHPGMHSLRFEAFRDVPLATPKGQRGDQVFSWGISGVTRLWLLIRSPILANSAPEYPALSGNGEAPEGEGRLWDSWHKVAGRVNERREGRLRGSR